MPPVVHLPTARQHPQPPFAVTVREARLSFGGRVLFDHLDFDLAGGAWTCLLGPSGVGKSTLLRLIAGLRPDGGATRLSGQVSCSDGAPVSGRVSLMAQRDLLLPWLSVLDNVCLGSRLRGEAADHERALDLLTRVGLADSAFDRPDTLSGGMRQRAALARTLMEGRPLVLMDEPFSALDAISRLRLQDLAAELLAGHTVLLVTHDPLEALRLGHRVHVMAGDFRAGRPARIDAALAPQGRPPRDVHDARILELQADLLERLAEASE